MNKIEQIKVEIEKLKDKYRNLMRENDREKSNEGGYKIEALNELLLNISEEKPSEDLEKEISHWFDKLDDKYCMCVEEYSIQDIKDTARYFAEWQKKRMMKKAIGWIKWNNDNGGCLFDGWQDDFIKAMED